MRVIHQNGDYLIKINELRGEVQRLRNGEVFGPIPIKEPKGEYHGKDAFVRFGETKKTSIEITNYVPGSLNKLTQLDFLISDEPLTTAQREGRRIGPRYLNDNKIEVEEVFEQEE